MGPIMKDPSDGGNANESQETPAFPDYMLDPDAVVSPSPLMAPPLNQSRGID